MSAHTKTTPKIEVWLREWLRSTLESGSWVFTTAGQAIDRLEKAATRPGETWDTLSWGEQYDLMTKVLKGLVDDSILRSFRAVNNRYFIPRGFPEDREQTLKNIIRRRHGTDKYNRR